MLRIWTSEGVSGPFDVLDAQRDMRHDCYRPEGEPVFLKSQFITVISSEFAADYNNLMPIHGISHPEVFSN